MEIHLVKPEMNHLETDTHGGYTDLPCTIL